MLGKNAPLTETAIMGQVKEIKTGRDVRRILDEAKRFPACTVRNVAGALERQVAGKPIGSERVINSIRNASMAAR